MRVVREGKVLNAAEPFASLVEQEFQISHATRLIKVGDCVCLRSFGSIGIVDKINNDEVEVRVKALRFRE